MHSMPSMDEFINLFIAVWVVFSVGIILWALYDWSEVEEKYQERDLKRHDNKK